MDTMPQQSAGVMSCILKNGIILDQEDITTLEDTNINTEYYYIDLKYYLAKGSSFKCRGFTLLHKLVLLTNKYPKLNNVIREYITSFPEEVNKVNTSGMTALHLATTTNNYTNDTCSVETTKLLLLHNADINTKSNNGYTALMQAAYYFHVRPSIEVVKLLLEYNADITARNNDKNDALTVVFAYESGQSSSSTVKLLLEYDANV